MSWNTAAPDTILLIFSFCDFKDKCLGIGQLNKEYNKIINSEISHFNEWLSKFFDYNAKNLYITDWMQEEKSIPIEPLIQTIDGKRFCIGIEPLSMEEIENQISIQSEETDQIFSQLTLKYKFEWKVEETGRISAPSWKHLMFQKEIVEALIRRDIGTVKIPVGLFEFTEVYIDGDNLAVFINQQKRGIALFKFISSSKAVREKIKKLGLGADVDYKALACEYATRIMMQTYHLKPQPVI